MSHEERLREIGRDIAHLRAISEWSDTAQSERKACDAGASALAITREIAELTVAYPDLELPVIVARLVLKCVTLHQEK